MSWDHVGIRNEDRLTMYASNVHPPSIWTFVIQPNKQILTVTKTNYLIRLVCAFNIVYDFQFYKRKTLTIMGNMSNVADHDCDITFDTENVECDGRGRCKKKVKISHTNNSPITEPVCKSFWKAACNEEGKKCDVDVVASIEFEPDTRASRPKAITNVCERIVWKKTPTPMDFKQKMDEILGTISNEYRVSKSNSKDVQMRTNYVILLWEYAETALSLQKAVQQHQLNLIKKSQITNLINQYNTIMKNETMWAYLKQVGIECENTLHDTVQIIHKNIIKALGRH
jgi:hypothetical protein